MALSRLLIYLLKFYIPAFFSLLFRAYGLGYRSRKRLVLGISVYTLYIMIIPGALMLMIGYGQYTHIAAAVMLSGSLSVLIFSTDTPEKTFFLQFTQSCFVTAMSVFINMLRHLTGFPYELFDAVQLVFCLAFYCTGIRFWAKPLRYIADHTESRQPFLVLLPLTTNLIMYIIPVYPVRNFTEHPVFCSLIIIGIASCYLMFLHILYRNLREISRLMAEENKACLLETEIESYQDYLAAAKQSRHDMRHHNALLSEYLEAGNIDDARAYLKEMDEALTEGALWQYCKNPVINAVLRIYERRAHAANAAFAAQVELPEKLPLKAAELGGILSNILENALRACVQDTRHPAIVFRAWVEEQELLLEVQNTAAAEVHFADGIPQSDKPGGGNGVKSILRIVSAHGGLVTFRQEEGEFLTRILLPLQKM